ncbi:MAG: hypothetical protein ACLP9S_05200 [Syntrophales bacterium]
MSYILYIDGNPTQMVNSLEKAKQLAEPYITDRKTLRIESLVAPARSEIWIYDSKDKDWVEQI